MPSRNGTQTGGWLVFSGAAIALYGGLVMPWIRSLRGREAGITGIMFVLVGIALVVAGIGQRRGWWQ